MPYDVLKNWLVIQLECSDAAILTNPRYFSNLSSWLMPMAHVFFWLQVMNYICSLFFLVELILRMIAWLGDPDNFIDLSTK